MMPFYHQRGPVHTEDLIRRVLLIKRGLHLRQQGARLDRLLSRSADRRSPSPSTSVV